MNWYDDDTGADDGTYRATNLPWDKFARKKGIMRSGRLPNSYEFYTRYVQPLPNHVIVPASIPVSRLYSAFGVDSEILLVRIINAISEKVSSDLRIANMAGELYKALNHHCRDHGIHYLDRMIIAEQVGLDLRDVLTANGFYIQNRWMPYMYEATVGGSNLLLKRPDTFDDFCDHYIWAAGIDEYFESE